VYQQPEGNLRIQRIAMGIDGSPRSAGAHHANLGCRVITTPGRSGAVPPVPGVVIRPIRPDDATRLRAFHARLSDDTIRNRFFGFHRFLPDAEVDRFTSPVRGNEVALVATFEEEIVAVGRYIRLSGDNAEVAFVVQDAYQGHGIGSRLLTLLAQIAWDDGIHRFVADTFAANLAMLGVFKHTPGAVTVESLRRDGSVVHLVMGVVPAENRLARVADRAASRRPTSGRRRRRCQAPRARRVSRAISASSRAAARPLPPGAKVTSSLGRMALVDAGWTTHAIRHPV
jgi:GNAT superfamily N-acetyltransferase